MNLKQSIASCCLLFVSLSGCNDRKNQPVGTDTAKQGSIRISVDESFMPVIDEQIKVYEASFPAAKIGVQYKPEASCMKDIFRDTACRMAIVTRGLSKEEEQFFRDTLGYAPQWGLLAKDAIAIVVNAASPDTNLTMAALKERLSGTGQRKGLVILDGLNATGTIRFAIDSILRGAKFDTSVVKGVADSKSVLDYVAADPNAIGMVGISWIGNPEDSVQTRMLKKVKIAKIAREQCEGKPFVKPSQASIAAGAYPLVRGLYYILKENHEGLGTGFVGFMRYERGQLIFRRAYLQPEKMNFDVRDVNINIEQ